jgi:hypothetical protein
MRNLEAKYSNFLSAVFLYLSLYRLSPSRIDLKRTGSWQECIRQIPLGVIPDKVREHTKRESSLLLIFLSCPDLKHAFSLRSSRVCFVGLGTTLTLHLST